MQERNLCWQGKAMFSDVSDLKLYMFNTAHVLYKVWYSAWRGVKLGEAY